MSQEIFGTSISIVNYKITTMFQPGQSGNPGGRPTGSKNKVQDEIKEAFAKLLQNKIPELESWITRVAEKDPAKALEIFTKVSERFVPQLSRQEVTGANGEDLFKSVTFNFITADDDSDPEQLQTLQSPEEDSSGDSVYEG
jgi:hypothetical protein